MGNTLNEDRFVTRRKFLYITIVTSIGTILGCGGPFKYKRSELGEVLRGYSAYRLKNPNAGNKQIQTFLDNVLEHGAYAGGTQYRLAHNAKIVATARGKIIKVRTRKGYHGLEDDVYIDHGGGFHTRYFHMKANSSELSWFKEVNRGDIVGLASYDLPFKTSMKFNGILGDMNDYGHSMGYMQYWDGTQLDHSYDEIVSRSKSHIELISELRVRYVGPGSEPMKKTNFYGIPVTLSHDEAGQYNWSYAMVFRMLKHIYDKQPNLFIGTDNDDLIKEIYNSQPVVNTLPFLR